MKLDRLIRFHLASSEKLIDQDAYFSGTVEGMFGPKGEHWKGPTLDKADAHYEDSMGRVRDNFLVQNLLASVLDTHTNALLSKEIEWDSKPVTADDELTQWYYLTEVQETLQDAGRALLWAAGDQRRTSSILRLHVPKRAQNEEGQVERSSLDEALERAVRLTHCPPGSAGMLKDDDGEVIGAYYVYKDGRKNRLELVALDSEIARNDWGFLESDAVQGDTVIQIRSGLAYSKIEDEARYPLGGNLTIFEMSRKPLITEDIITQQDGLNTQWTYLNRHASASAFLERVVLNGQPPGRWVNEQGQPDPKGTIFEQTPMGVGGGTTNFIGGLTDQNGNLTNASMVWREPSSSEPLLKNIEAHKEAILTQSSQLHRLIAGDATATGVARQQAVQEFLTSLGPTETQLKFAAKWLLETALRLGGYFEKGTEAYTDVNITPRISVEAVEPTAEEKRAVLELFKGGLLSQEDAMRQIGTTDVATQLPKIKLEAAERVRQAQEAFQARQGAGEDGAGAAQ